MKMKIFKPNEKWAKVFCAPDDIKNKVAPVVLVRKGPHPQNTSNKSRAVRTYSIEVGSAEANLIKRMNLDEMLEASKVIQMGTIGEAPLFIESPNAQKYARSILALYNKEVTKPVAAKMIDNLNTQIIRTNKRTTNAAESKRLYRNLMREK